MKQKRFSDVLGLRLSRQALRVLKERGISTNGKQIVVENSDHGIPEQAPESVVGAVHEIVTDVRNRQGQ